MQVQDYKLTLAAGQTYTSKIDVTNRLGSLRIWNGTFGQCEVACKPANLNSIFTLILPASGLWVLSSTPALLTIGIYLVSGVVTIQAGSTAITDDYYFEWHGIEK